MDALVASLPAWLLLGLAAIGLVAVAYGLFYGFIIGALMLRYTIGNWRTEQYVKRHGLSRNVFPETRHLPE